MEQKENRMIKYYGVLKTKRQAMDWARKLRKNGTDKHIACAKMLERNWHSIASRPALAIEVMAMVETDPICVEREGSILNTIMKRKSGSKSSL